MNAIHGCSDLEPTYTPTSSSNELRSAFAAAHSRAFFRIFRQLHWRRHRGVHARFVELQGAVVHVARIS